jgi:hypothetical protein
MGRWEKHFDINAVLYRPGLRYKSDTFHKEAVERFYFEMYCSFLDSAPLRQIDTARVA